MRSGLKGKRITNRALWGKPKTYDGPPPCASHGDPMAGVYAVIKAAKLRKAIKDK